MSGTANGVAELPRPKRQFLNASVIRESAEQFLGSKEGTLNLLVDRLVLHFSTQKKLADCDKCGGRSSDALDHCPFCGDKDSAETDKVATKTKALARKKVADVAVVDSTIPSQKEYDAFMKRVLKEKNVQSISVWRTGQIAHDAQEKRYWMCPRGEDGLPLYRTFEKYCEEELGYSRSFISKAVRAFNFFKEEQIEKFGSTYITMLVDVADDSIRARVMKKLDADPSLSCSTVAKLIRDYKTQHVKPKVEPKARVVSEVKEPQLVTALFPKERIDLPMLCRQHKKDGSEPKPATDLSDNPWAVYQTNNGINIFVGLQEGPNGQYVVNLHAIRADDI